MNQSLKPFLNTGEGAEVHHIGNHTFNGLTNLIPFANRFPWIRTQSLYAQSDAGVHPVNIEYIYVNVLPTFDNPFQDKTVDRSQPVLLQSMRDLHRYVAADGTFQVIVDLQENKENVPDFLVNRRTLFVGSGTVEESFEAAMALSREAIGCLDALPDSAAREALEVLALAVVRRRK